MISRESGSTGRARGDLEGNARLSAASVPPTESLVKTILGRFWDVFAKGTRRRLGSKRVDAKLNSKAFDSMKYSERSALQIETIDQFITKYPREAEPSRRLIELTWLNPGLVPTLRDRFEKLSKSNPDDPLAQALGGYSLAPADPERGLEEMNLAKRKAPAFPVPYLLLAEDYSYGKPADQKAMTENITGYFKLCPASADHEAHRILAKTQDKELSATVAKALRARLEAKDNSRLTDYETLWALNSEFVRHRNIPPYAAR
jgi:hypothetical protein